MEKSTGLIAGSLKKSTNVLLRKEVSVRTAVLQGHAVASGAHAVARHSQRAVIIRQSSVLQHRHVPQEGIRLLLCLGSLTKDAQRGENIGRSVHVNKFSRSPQFRRNLPGSRLNNLPDY